MRAEAGRRRSENNLAPIDIPGQAAYHRSQKFGFRINCW
jgi:hypothetical protein